MNTNSKTVNIVGLSLIAASRGLARRDQWRNGRK